MSKANGGPAFPVESVDKGSYGRVCGSFGMSLRDYFAAKAMQSLIIGWEKVNGHFLPDCDCANLAINALHIADAMLKERKSSES